MKVVLDTNVLMSGMVWPVEKMLREALKLDPEDRALIAAELSEPVEDPEEVRQAWVRLAVERYSWRPYAGRLEIRRGSEAWVLPREGLAYRLDSRSWPMKTAFARP